MKSLFTYQLLDWISPDNLQGNGLSLNPNAIEFLEKHPEKIIWDYLSENPSAVHILKKNPEKNQLVVSLEKSRCDSYTRGQSRQN